MIFLVFVLLLSTCSAQYPNLLAENLQSMGQCLSDDDCAIFGDANSTLILLGLHCNEATSRCELADGRVVGPGFDLPCNYFNISMSYSTYPSYSFLFEPFAVPVYNHQKDGIVVVDMKFPATTLQFQGVLRLYLLELTSPSFQTTITDDNLTAYYDYTTARNDRLVGQQSVNSPETRFVFRNLESTTRALPINPSQENPYNLYGLAYFDSTGCVLTLPVFSMTTVNKRGSLLAPPAESVLFSVPYPKAPDTPGPLTLTDFTSYVDPTGKIAYFQANANWLFENEPLNGNYRCIFGQVYDMTGRVISSKIDKELSGNYGNPNGGLWYPPFDPSPLSNTPNFGLANQTYGQFAGYVKLQLGVGFCSNKQVYDPLISANITVRTILQDGRGVFEGYLAQNITLDLNKNNTGIPLYPMFPYGLSLYAQFDPSLMYYRLDDIMFNTYLWPLTNIVRNPFGNSFPGFVPVDFSKQPIISVERPGSTFPASSKCDADNLATISYDYSGLNMSVRFPNQAPSLFLYLVNTSSPSQTTTLVDQRAPFILPGSFTVARAGLYCLDLWHDLLDGLLFRLFLRTCFQVGSLGATATQLDMFYVMTALDPFPDTSLPYNGYGSYVFTNIYLGLPQMLVLPKAVRFAEPRVRFLRYAADPDEEKQIELFSATNISVYKTDFSLLNAITEYSLVYAGEEYTVWTLAISNFNKEEYYSIAYNGGGQVQTEIMIVDFEIVIPGVPDEYILEQVPYSCETKVDFSYIASPTIQSRVFSADSICPGQLVSVTTNSRGGTCMNAYNPFLVSVNGNNPPYREPCTYFEQYYNIDNPDVAPVFLYGTQNGVTAAIASNIKAKVVVHDMMGVIGETEFKIESNISPNSTTISFKPPVPFCDISGIQRVIYDFVISGSVNVIDPVTNTTVPAILGWEPLNVLAQAQYNPNSDFFDLPSECALLQTMSAYDVFVLCHRVNTTILPQCTNCTQLPIAYENTNGTQLLIGPATPTLWWEAYAWVPTIYFNPVTLMRVYCRFALSAFTPLPDPMFLLVTNLRRIQRNGQTCPGLINCFAIDIDIFLDPRFEPFYPLSGVDLISNPSFGSSENVTVLGPNPFTNVSHVVSLEQLYIFTLFYDDIFCTVDQDFLSSATGPIIPLVRTTHSVCSSPTGSAVIYINYVDPNLPLGTLVRQCMFWQGYQYQSLGPFFQFDVGANVNIPLLLPYSPAFAIPPNETRFYGVSAGLQRFVVYDQCEGTFPCPPILPDCVDFVDQTTLQVTGARNSVITEFQIEQFLAPGGGLVIALDSSVYAQCYGDTYFFTFTVFDDKGENTGLPPQQQYGPYYATIVEPITGAIIYETTPQCIFDQFSQSWTGGIPLETSGNPPTLQEVGYKVRLFTLNTFIRTGVDFGFRQSGNFSFVVKNCASGCIQTFTLAIEMVNPFDIILSPVAAQCSSGTLGLGSLIKTISGGTPFLPGELPNYYYGDYDTVRNAQYITCWLTPLNPTIPNCFNLGARVLPGDYFLNVTDKNNCTARVNVTVPGPPPFKVEIAGVSTTCSATDVSTFQLVVTEPGNGPPYYILQATTNVSIGTNVTYQFANAAGTTQCLDLLDGKFCRYSTQLCAFIPLPEAINVTANSTDSCPTSNTGTAVVVSVNGNTSLTGYTCLWQNTDASSVVSFNSASSCEQIAVPGNTELIVTVSNIIGCQGSAVVFVGQQPLIVITQISRTTMGQLDQRPCIDRAVLTVTGGSTGPFYIVSLVDDITGANITYNNNYTINITGVCRSVQYIVSVKNSDGRCGQTFISKDPNIGFGDTIANPLTPIPLALPPFGGVQGGQFSLDETYSNQPAPKEETKKKQSVGVALLPVWIVLSITGFAFFVLVVLFASIGMTKKKT